MFVMYVYLSCSSDGGLSFHTREHVKKHGRAFKREKKEINFMKKIT